MKQVPGTWEHGEPPMPMQYAQKKVRHVVDGLKRQGSINPRIFRMGECEVIIAQEPVPNGELLWHLSISRTDRHPNWDEIKAARYWLLPEDLCFGLLLPPPQFYVNIERQDHVFHLHEITDPRAPWEGG